MGNSFELLELGGLIYTELTLGSTKVFEMWNLCGQTFDSSNLYLHDMMNAFSDVLHDIARLN